MKFSTTTSTDGTTIAYEVMGEGEPVVLVSGATSHRAVMTNLPTLAEALTGFSLVAWDRRGRGDSGDTAPYSPAREVEDLQAVVAATGAELVHGHSSGAVLTLDALAAGLPVRRASVYEPPLIVDGSRPPVPRDLLDRLRAAPDGEEQLRIFFTDAIGVPGDVVIGQLKQTPFWDDLLAAAATTVYDTELMQGLMSGDPLPSDRWSSISVPVLVMAGGASAPYMRSGAQALVEVLSDAHYAELAGQDHGAADDVLAAAIVPFLSRR
jgi:pimeloyl-ACP methyl ester carboxylesterase